MKNNSKCNNGLIRIAAECTDRRWFYDTTWNITVEVPGKVLHETITRYDDETMESLKYEIMLAIEMRLNLFSGIRNAWSRETAHSSCQKEWTKENSEYGQSCVSALVFRDFYGGDLVKSKVEGNPHYFNQIYGHALDLTSVSRLYKKPVEYQKCKVCTVEERAELYNRHRVLFARVAPDWSKVTAECIRELDLHSKIYYD